MKVIDATGANLDLKMIKEAIKGLPDRAVARLHPTQEASYLLLGIEVQSVISEKLNERRTEPFAFLPAPFIDGLTMAGHRIISDAWFPEDRIRFEVDDKPIAAIIHLSVPAPYEAL